MSTELFFKMNTESAADDKAVGEKHAPIVEGPCCAQPGEAVKIKVDVGGGRHPNTNEHHIQWVELRFNGLCVARADLSPVITSPIVEFAVNWPGEGVEMSAIARCNLHGLWESKVASCAK